MKKVLVGGTVIERRDDLEGIVYEVDEKYRVDLSETPADVLLAIIATEDMRPRTNHAGR